MNKIDKNPNYKELYKVVKNRFDRTAHFNYGPFDETYYTMRVYECSKDIMEEIKKRKPSQKIKVQQVLVAAILHDVGKVKLKPSKLFAKHKLKENVNDEWHKHAELSVPIAKRLLKKMGHSPEFMDEVSYLIKNHALRADKLNERTLELEILQDADLIADIGLAGFVRCFLYSGKFSRSIIDSIRYLQGEDRTNSGKELNLQVSKEIAKQELKIQNNLVEEISNELDTDLLD